MGLTSPGELAQAGGLAVVLFVTTNIDDVFLILAFFSDGRLRPWHVVLGQLAGIAALTAASVVCALGSVVIPPAWIGLLGLLPLAIGVKKLLELRRPDDDDDELPAAGPSALRSIGAVAAVTIANGGDNLGVWVPVFATTTWPRIAVTSVVFLALTLVWCAAGHALVNHRTAGERIKKVGRALLPFVLVALGLVILWDARGLVLR